MSAENLKFEEKLIEVKLPKTLWRTCLLSCARSKMQVDELISQLAIAKLLDNLDSGTLKNLIALELMDEKMFQRVLNSTANGPEKKE
ncbi:MAG TPA: hypothetical protein VGB26_14005 [Nitrospiria bacterium]|jgi:hypothetical protein